MEGSLHEYKKGDPSHSLILLEVPSMYVYILYNSTYLVCMFV